MSFISAAGSFASSNILGFRLIFYEEEVLILIRSGKIYDGTKSYTVVFPRNPLCCHNDESVMQSKRIP